MYQVHGHQGLEEVQGVRPWKADTFKFSTDPELEAKVTDIEAYSQTACRPAKPLVRVHLRKAVNKAHCRPVSEPAGQRDRVVRR